MKEILIGKDVDYAQNDGASYIADIGEVNDLIAGSFAVFTEKGVLINDDDADGDAPADIAALLPDVERFIIAVGTSSGQARMSQPILRRNARLATSEYAAAVAQVTHFGDPGSGSKKLEFSTISVGSYVTFRVIKNLGQGSGIEETQITSVVAQSGEDAENLVEKIVADYNAKPDAWGTLAKVGSGSNTDMGWSFTANEAGVRFDFALEGLAENTPITRTTEGAPGSGVGTTVRKLEDELNTYRGQTNRIWQADKYFSVSLEADASANYDMYQILHTAERDFDFPVGRPTVSQEVLLALPDGETGSNRTKLEVIFDQLLGEGEISSGQATTVD